MSKLQDRQLPQPPTILQPILLVFLRELIGSLLAFMRDVTLLQNAGKQSILHLDILENEPGDPFDGMIVYADGTSWDPGGGEGAYVRTADAWVKLH